MYVNTNICIYACVSVCVFACIHILVCTGDGWPSHIGVASYSSAASGGGTGLTALFC